MVAGLEEISEGVLKIGERVVNHVPSRDRDIAMVFQSYALYPHLSVYENIAFGLRLKKMPKQEIEERVERAAQLLGLTEFLKRKPRALSGGQRQRVAMGRAIVRQPAAFLMDEPLSNLDAKLRVDMRAQLARLHERLAVTTVYVTHDQIEAMTLGQRVAVMRAGRLQQVDTPQRLYRDPANLFVAAFIGSPSMNLVEADVRDGHAEFAGYRIPLSASAPETSRLVLGIRPQDFADAGAADPSLPVIEVEVAVVEDLGSTTHVIFPVEAPSVDVEAVRAATDEKERAMLLASDRRALFTAEVGGSADARAGERMRLAVNPERFHFFSLETGESLRPAPVPA
jgi:multiple sugar transport system ATP-binding protein